MAPTFKYLSYILILPFIFSLFVSCGKEDIDVNEDVDYYTEKRMSMLNDQIKNRGIDDKYVLMAMENVKRHLFVTEEHINNAYNDYPLPIGQGQTISQPYIVAFMTQAAGVLPDDKVLEIGTGSGYQAAVLAEITDYVYSIEIKESLVAFAQENLKNAGYDNVAVKHGDGYFGWEENGPYDAILITCAANHIPASLIKQLKDGGRLVIPLGDPTYYQTLTLLTKVGEDIIVDHLLGVAFVPMTGEALR